MDSFFVRTASGVIAAGCFVAEIMLLQQTMWGAFAAMVLGLIFAGIAFRRKTDENGEPIPDPKSGLIGWSVAIVILVILYFTGPLWLA